MYISTFYVLAQSFVKNRHFLWAAQRQKKCREKAYFSTKFCHFYIGHIKSRFFSKPLRGQVGHGDVHTTF
jgi:hypothetical protein